MAFVGVVLLVVRSATFLVAPYLVVSYRGTNDIDVLLTLSFFALPWVSLLSWVSLLPWVGLLPWYLGIACWLDWVVGCWLAWVLGVACCVAWVDCWVA